MSSARSKLCAAVALLALTAAAGCAEPAPDLDDPGAAARHLFALATDAPTEAQIEALFDAEAVEERRVALLDALDVIAGSAAPDLLGVDATPEADEAFVDLAVGLPGEGRAVYSLKLRRLEENGWRIAWFQGPGVEWPPRDRKGASLTTSAPPEPPSDDW